MGTFKQIKLLILFHFEGKTTLLCLNSQPFIVDVSYQLKRRSLYQCTSIFASDRIYSSLPNR